jgi:ABC transport permease subunit
LKKLETKYTKLGVGQFSFILPYSFNFFTFDHYYYKITHFILTNEIEYLALQLDNTYYKKVATELIRNKLAIFCKKHSVRFEVIGDEATFFVKREFTKVKSNKRNATLLIDCIGHRTVEIFTDISTYSKFIFLVLTNFFTHERTSIKKMQRNEFCIHLNDVCMNALPITVLIGALIGLIYSFQGYQPLSKFGAQSFLIQSITISFNREVAAFLVGIILCSRSATAFTADICAMKANQEISSMEMMLIDPLKLIVIPRALATVFAAPILTMYCFLSALVGCLFMVKSIGFTFVYSFYQMQKHFLLTDFLGSMIKSIFFGYFIATVACYIALNSKCFSSQIGKFATKSVVISIITVVLIDGIFTLLYYALGF